MKKVIFILFLTIAITACNSSEKKLQGGWVVDKAYFHNHPIVYDLFSNSFDLNKDHTCQLPISQVKERHTDVEKGHWAAFTQNDTLYLKITTTNKVFNRTFKVLNYRTITDSVSFGALTKATLIADSLKLECTKAPY